MMKYGKKRKFGLVVGVMFAVALHAGVILFGGALFADHKTDYGTLQQVDLLSEDTTAPDKEKDKPKEPEEQTEKLETETEQVPDAAEIIRNLEISPVVSAPELEAASLSAIEAALSGQSRGGDFAEALSFSSGGRIGGVGKAGTADKTLDDAFNLSEIDQKPRPIFQSAPVYPSGMRSVEGVVSVLFVVDRFGKVINPRVEKSTHREFEKPAIDAVKQWKFEPAFKAGQRVPCKMRVPIRFQPR
jgi:periplasmic protein TonB